LKEITDQKRNGFEPQGAYIFDNISYAPLPVCINFEEIDNFATIQRFPNVIVTLMPVGHSFI